MKFDAKLTFSFGGRMCTRSHAVGRMDSTENQPNLEANVTHSVKKLKLKERLASTTGQSSKTYHKLLEAGIKYMK